ncbi:MAG: hypothetical protein Q9218_004912 [Villophora microphyllina]
MPPSRRLLARESSPSTSLTPTMTSLLIALIALAVTGLSLVAILYLLRSYRKAKQQRQVQSLAGQAPPSKRSSNHRRLTISATPYARDAANSRVYNEKEFLDSPSSSAPSSPVPEIRITFPEEEDDSGKRKSGRVVVVRISEMGGVGLEPYHDEKLPPYGTHDAERFESLDLDRMGGLKEAGIDSKRL